MKPLFIFHSLLFALNSKATNDTLTRAQVYNFSVGDTFDYEYHDYGYYYNADPSAWDHFSYYRTVITAKFYSQFQDTLFYVRKIDGFLTNYVYAVNTTTDTLIIDSLQLYAIYYGNRWATMHSDSVSGTQNFNGNAVNKTSIYSAGNREDMVFAAGLGEIYYDYVVWDRQGDTSTTINTLIYYSQNGIIWGTPYYVAVGIPNITQPNPTINLFPTVNNGSFKITIANANNSSYQLAIYDLTGREVKRTSLTNGTNNIQLQNPGTGMYLWSVLREGATLKSGKLIIQ